MLKFLIVLSSANFREMRNGRLSSVIHVACLNLVHHWKERVLRTTRLPCFKDCRHAKNQSFHNRSVTKPSQDTMGHIIIFRSSA